MTGPVDPPSIHSPTIRDAGYFDATEALCTLFKRLAVANVKFEPTAQPTFSDKCLRRRNLRRQASRTRWPDRSAGGARIQPGARRRRGRTRLGAAAGRRRTTAGRPRRFSVSADRIDLSFIVSEELRAGDVLQTVRDAGKNEVTAASIFDIYRGGNIPVGRKAVGIRLLISSFSRTLTIDEGRAIAGRLADVVRDRFGAELRT